jgi:sec-independent protein translocase protein TatA
MFSGGFSIWHWLIVGIIVLLLFGKGRFSDMMGDVAKGLKSFKKGMAEEDTPPKSEEARRLRDESRLDPPAERSRDAELDERREP